MLDLAVCHVKPFEHVLHVGALVDSDGSSLLVSSELHAEVPVELSLVRQLVLVQKILDELLIEWLAVCAAGAIVDLEAEDNGLAILCLVFVEGLVDTCRLEPVVNQPGVDLLGVECAAAFPSIESLAEKDGFSGFYRVALDFKEERPVHVSYQEGTSQVELLECVALLSCNGVSALMVESLAVGAYALQCSVTYCKSPLATSLALYMQLSKSTSLILSL